MNYKILFKLTISALLLILVVRTIELEAFAKVISTLSPTLVLLVVVGYLVGQVISVIKWKLLLKYQGVTNVSLPIALHAYFTGMFINVLGVGTVGGDMTRAILISNDQLSKTRCVSSVIADRAHGLLVLTMLGTLAVASFGGNMLPGGLWSVLTAGGLALVVGWFIGPAILLKAVPQQHHFRVKVEQIAGAFPNKPTNILVVTLLSLAFHLLQIGLHQLMAASLGVHISWSALLVTIPFVNILSSLPVSWQGLGVRENAYAFFLVPGILASEQALAMGAMWLFAVTVAGVIGGLVSLIPIGNNHKKRHSRSTTFTAPVLGEVDEDAA